MNNIQYKKYITRNYVQQHRDYIFVFGDNDQRFGYGGQAREIRGESNSVGIRVKKSPSMNENSFYTDNELMDNIIKIDSDINHLLEASYGSKTIIFPENGIGTGFAQLPVRAPKTFTYLNTILRHKFNIINKEI
jgi:hypothetical protein